ncbi:MAG: SAM-dependent methyltransferase [Haliea sp.]|nr:MAG: SAM-dependent methyltransferase [Haliea sp.]
MPHTFSPLSGPPPEAPGYFTKLETVHGSGADVVLRSLRDRSQYHDPDGEAERAGIPPASWPLFGLLWPSGQVLAGVMASYELGGKRILELGCGLGLASIVAHRRGGDITASDCHPLAGGFLRENLRLNGLPAMKYHAANWSAVNAGLGLFDLIIGSDVLYDRGQPQALSQFIDRHSRLEVEVLIVDPDRGNQASFNRKMVLLGYAHSKTAVIALPDGAVFKGKLHRYARGPWSGC